MPLPEFTHEEQYLISYVKSPDLSKHYNGYMWGYLIGCSVLAGFAAYQQHFGMVLAAFAILCGFRIYEDRYGSRWNPIWRTLIEKYEAAIMAKDETTGAS